MWMWLGSIGVAVVLLLILLLTLPLETEISFSKFGKDLNGFIRVSYLFGIISIKRSLTEVKPMMTDEGPSLHTSVQPSDEKGDKKKQHRILTTEEVWKVLKDWRKYLKKLRRAIPILRWVMRRTIITHLVSEVDLGTGDAPSTGVAVGATYSTVNVVLGQLSHYCSLQKMPQVLVRPDFEREVFDLNQKCIFKIRLGYAIWAGVRSLLIWKSKRGS